MQRYHCLACSARFQSKRRQQAKRDALYGQYVFKRQNLAQLAEYEGKSMRWVQTQLDAGQAAHDPLPPQQTVIVADTTFWGEGYGVCVLRSPTLKRNLCWTEVGAETAAVYDQSLGGLLERRWIVTAAVIDGRRGVAKVFERQGIPVQHCQFHQMKTVTKYLTRTPQSIAGQELRRLACTLHKTTETVFVAELAAWHARHELFFNERSLTPHKKRSWEYTHRKLRAAYHSLKTNLPYLFTHQKYPDLHIPNTTNSLDGMFSQLKNKLAVHRGLRRDRRFKMISAILAQKPKTASQKDH